MKFRPIWIIHILICAGIMALFAVQQSELSRKYDIGVSYAAEGNFEKACEYMNMLAEYKDAPEKLEEYTAEIDYLAAVGLMESGKWEEAEKKFEKASENFGDDYKDAKEMIYHCGYEQARELANNYDIYTAELMFLKLPRDFKDVSERKLVITENKKFKGDWICETEQGEIQLETDVYIDMDNVPRVDVKMFDSEGLLYDNPNVMEGKGLEIMGDRFSWDVEIASGVIVSLSFVYKDDQFTVMKRPIVEGTQKLLFKKVVGTNYDIINSQYMNTNF